jgi:dihydrofolate synthase/folylpolyglutamate synthase
MTYPDAIRFLYGLQLFGSKLGLDNTRRLAALAGNPQDQLRFIHVAGTNGKGSTCAMLESIYRASGLRVGLFTSPHLVAFGERLQVNRHPISQADVARLTGELQALLGQFPASAHPTFFEVVTVMALRYFAEQQCDLVIWETGLGGRLDATNIVTPLASVITNIQFDHQQWLGDTLPQIAAEKAGIIKPAVPVITAVDDSAAFRILYATAREKAAPFVLITRAQADNLQLPPLRLPLPGEHQRLNAAVAVWTVRAVAGQIPVSDEAMWAGLSSVNWSGRLQLIERSPGRKILLDGAHNVGSAEVLRASLHSLAGTQPVTLILGILRDKDWQPMCRMLAPLAARILTAPVASRRGAPPAELAALCRTVNPAAEVVECATLAAALELAHNDPFFVVAGSLYLVGQAMELLGLSPVPAANERTLNEWHTAAATACDCDVAL